MDKSAGQPNKEEEEQWDAAQDQRRISFFALINTTEQEGDNPYCNEQYNLRSTRRAMVDMNTLDGFPDYYDANKRRVIRGEDIVVNSTIQLSNKLLEVYRSVRS